MTIDIEAPKETVSVLKERFVNDSGKTLHLKARRKLFAMGGWSVKDSAGMLWFTLNDAKLSMVRARFRCHAFQSTNLCIRGMIEIAWNRVAGKHSLMQMDLLLRKQEEVG